MGKSSAKKAKSDRINALRKQYDAFLEEDKKRKERNDFILGKLDKMRYTTALVVPRHKPNVLETRLTMMDRIAYQPEYSPVRDLQPSSLKNPSNLFSDMPMKSTEDALIQEISKKYILIPKLRTTFINSHNNIWNDTAGQIHNTDKLPERRPKQDTVPINDLKLNPSENADWKDKYEILNILKNEEKEKQSENTFVDYKEGSKHFARAESFLENNQIPINYDRDRTEAMKVTEIPEKDIPNDKLFYGISDTSQLKLDANTTENEDVTKPDHTVIIGGKIKSITLDYEPEAKEKSDVSEETTEDNERTQLPNLNMSQKYEHQQTNNNLSMSRNYEPQDTTNLSIGQNYESQNATNLSMSQNYEPHDATNLSMSQNYEPHDATNLSMSQNYEPHDATNLSMSQNYEPHDATNLSMSQNYEPHDATNLSMSQNYAPQDETNLNVTQTYEQHNATNLSMSQYEPQPESDVNIIAPATLNDEGNHVTEENAYYQEEYAVEGDSSNVQNDSISALQHEDTVYTDSNEVGPTTILDHNITETLNVTNAENTDVNYIEPAYEQPGTTSQPLESIYQESELANEGLQPGNEQPNNFADMTESIQEFDSEQGGMFVTESVEQYPSQQGDETTALEYAANEYAQNEAYNYYENAQPEAYPVELNNDEMTQQYDPLYEQQYAGVEEQVEGQEYQQYQESEVVEQPEQAGVMQYDQQFMNQGMIEKDLDAEDGYAQQQNDFVVQPDAELVQDNEFVNQEPIKLSEPVRT
ncbi:asparagine-rich protein isoform X2 [Spodoptera frugiperda]|uniref:Asparagine-rich protein isoform X2 n=1 Tax=Spodoptera frugiperda TaxID=7108 RepID=A0A9R0EPX9_SPOFR|nr:asparagine-rich protein isoform X2 [Spodoptera frugiperda]